MFKILLLTFVLGSGFLSQAQTTRFFEFRTNCGHGNWQDTTFIAAATDQVLIDTVLAHLSRPLSQRKFIAGTIDYGDGGHNRNASHWFLWHFVPDQWGLVDASIEVCDGCPYSDLDSDTAYWVGSLGSFCPWTGLPVREVFPTTGTNEYEPKNGLTIFPNPAQDRFFVRGHKANAVARIFNAQGQMVISSILTESNSAISISSLSEGLYFLKISSDNNLITKTVLVSKQ
ncbi:MAG: T9SS type A sorting domain-containing protein [Flavobacteriales bacterium]|nr:T9SS type A sorting domain-containing protein [Flavobacteriales bacterium]